MPFGKEPGERTGDDYTLDPRTRSCQSVGGKGDNGKSTDRFSDCVVNLKICIKMKTFL